MSINKAPWFNPILNTAVQLLSAFPPPSLNMVQVRVQLIQGDAPKITVLLQ